MGNISTSEAVCCRRPMKVLILGLRNAGKTTILYHNIFGESSLNFSKAMEGLWIEICQVKNKRLMVWELSYGRNTSRPLWRQYYQNTHTVVLVVDGTDRSKIEEVKEILHQLVNEDDLKRASIAIALNKRDLENCMSKEELEERLDVRSIQEQRPCKVFLTTVHPTAELQTEMPSLMEWIAEGPANTESGSSTKQYTDRFSTYFWQTLVKMKTLMFE